MKNLFKKLTFLFFYLCIITIVFYFLFIKIYQTNSLIFPYAITPFDICKLYPDTWKLLKKLYLLFLYLSNIILFLKFYNLFFHKTNKKQIPPFIYKLNEKELNLLIGNNELNKPIYIPEKGLYQSILITGTIGTRKNFFCNVSFY